MIKPSIPKGTRDFSPLEMAKRNYIFDTIRSVFYLYGFKQIETPAMENLSTLMGKYGEEGDKLLFKILNSGNFADKVDRHLWEEKESQKLTYQLSEKGLRYDLTVPFARYVVQHRDEIIFPFKRFQMQPVWRADRPQKGRYREFYQCDADMVGSDSLFNEVELIELIDEVFAQLKIRVSIKINNRKILAGIAEHIGEAQRIIDITVAIDKLDKIGQEAVNAELLAKGIPQKAVDRLQPVLLLSGTNAEKLTQLRTVLKESEVGLQGVDELQTVFDYLQGTCLKGNLELDLTLARGLNYYTGAIFEVKALDVEIGSITGGGRYDNLTGYFGLPNISGVGISFGADRIYDVLNQTDGYPPQVTNSTKLLFVAFDAKGLTYCLPLLRQVREAGISSELYPEAAKIKKQMNYANANNIGFVAIVGDNEMAEHKVMLKDMTTGTQVLMNIDELIAFVGAH